MAQVHGLAKIVQWHFDLRNVPFPESDWSNPQDALKDLYGWANSTANEAEAWYMRDKRWRAWAAQILRILTVSFGATGAIIPLVGAAQHREMANWGYVLLALGATCIGIDRIFGLSTGWMRCIITANAIRRRQSIFRVAWSAECAKAFFPDATRIDSRAIAELMDLVRDFIVDLSDLVSLETLEWRSELQAIMQQMQEQAGDAGNGRGRQQGSS